MRDEVRPLLIELPLPKLQPSRGSAGLGIKEIGQHSFALLNARPLRKFTPLHAPRRATLTCGIEPRSMKVAEQLCGARIDERLGAECTLYFWEV